MFSKIPVPRIRPPQTKHFLNTCMNIPVCCLSLRSPAQVLRITHKNHQHFVHVLEDQFMSLLLSLLPRQKWVPIFFLTMQRHNNIDQHDLHSLELAFGLCNAGKTLYFNQTNRRTVQIKQQIMVIIYNLCIFCLPCKFSAFWWHS